MKVICTLAVEWGLQVRVAEAAEAVLFIARSKYINGTVINGTVLYVDGGPEVFRGEALHV